MARPKAFIFDVYGTLFDVRSVVDEARLGEKDAWRVENPEGEQPSGLHAS